jgi:hypothetical protein
VATSHYCNGKWRDGPVAACPKHKGLSKKQPSVYRTPEDGDTTEDPGGGDSSAGDAGPAAGDSSTTAGDSSS